MGTLSRGPVPFLVIAIGVIAVIWLGLSFLPEGKPDPESPEALRAVLQSDATPEERADAAAQLGELGDEDSMPALLAAMDDADALVRGQAGTAVTKIMKEDYYFLADDPLEKRQAIIAKIRDRWDAYLRIKASESETSSSE